MTTPAKKRDRGATRTVTRQREEPLPDTGIDQDSAQDKDRYQKKPGTPEAGESRTIREGST